jgi:excinuclease ABC subunit C
LTRLDPAALESKLAHLPANSGVYIFYGLERDVLYVGKAKSLRSRVRSYFQTNSSDDRMYLPALVTLVCDLETIVTQSEKEAAILENSLIKEMKPRFNVKLRDDKEFLSVRLDPHASWPRLDLVRKPADDGAQYFGPYPSATSARRTLHLVEKHFKLRTCSDRELQSRRRPCLQHQIRRCDAPCVFEVDRQAYSAQVAAVGLFLDGRHDQLTAQLRVQMSSASQALEFELATTYRDQLRAVELVRESQRVVSVTDLDQDVLGLYRQGDLVELSLMSVREGRVVRALSYSSPRVEVPDDEVVAGFVREQYAAGEGTGLVPDEILVPVLPEGAAGVEEWLTERRAADSGSGVEKKAGRGSRVLLLAPERGIKRKLLDLAQENAQHAFAEKRRASEDIDERLARLQSRLRLPTLPRRIECTDISHLGGEDTYGAVVALHNGVPEKNRYRSFRVKSQTQGDDYAAMYEVLSRRFTRGKRDRDEPASGAPSQWELPDLFVVDGGRGQLSVAAAVAQDLGLFTLQLAGLAKERETTSGDKLVDRVYLPGQKNPIPLKPNSPELYLLAMARDEAHRFANRARMRSGRSRQFTSALHLVKGIGPRTRANLLKAFGALENILTATDEALLAVPGVHRGHVRALRALSSSPSPAADTVVAID